MANAHPARTVLHADLAPMVAIPQPASAWPPPHLSDWMVWGDAAFERAAREGKPVLLAIGSATCNWSQRMAGESFADPEAAARLQREFVCIGVERDLRPDLDSVYQITHLLLNGRPGGWPLTLFLCPRTRLPFMAGTWFPRLPDADNPLAFSALLERVTAFYRERETELEKLLAQLRRSLDHVSRHLATPLPEEVRLARACRGLQAQADLRFGGFGAEPRFALPVNLLFLLHACAREELPAAQLEHLRHSLQRMAESGINDCVEGGFFRYTRAADWQQPCYEKALYDNGLLLETYARAWLIAPDPLFERAATGVVDWLRRRMLAPDGAFFCAEGGCGGDYYSHQLGELQGSLDPRQWRLLAALADFDDEIGESTRVQLGQRRALVEVARQLALEETEAAQLWEATRSRLIHLRASRVRPPREAYVRVSSNALAIRGLALSARCWPQHLALAQEAVDAIGARLWIHQRLFSSCQGERLGPHAFLDDYAYLLDALLELLQTRWRDADYCWLLALAEAMITLHGDSEEGGFFYSAHDAEALPLRHKPFMDGVLPAANGVAARALLRLGYLSGEPRLLAAAEATLRAAAAFIAHSPETHLSLVQAHSEWLQPPLQVLLLDDGSMERWPQILRAEFGNALECYRLTPEDGSCPPDALDLEPGESVVCQGEERQSICRNLDSLVAQLQQLMAGASAEAATDSDSRPVVGPAGP